MTLPFSARFHFKYPNVSPKIGCYHIHAPEHISTTHRLGAPGFVIDRVKPPRIARHRRSIEFECRTLNVPMHVFMHRRSAFDSELVFTRIAKKDTTPKILAPVFTDAHSTHLFPALLAGNHMEKEKAFLRLLFKVQPMAAVKGHELSVTFSFWNPLIFFLVPLFPVFVAINGIEDMFYLRELEETGIPKDQGTWFDVYRKGVI